MSDNHILESSDIDGVAKFIIEKSQNIIVMVGAGISVSMNFIIFAIPALIAALITYMIAISD